MANALSRYKRASDKRFHSGEASEAGPPTTVVVSSLCCRSTRSFSTSPDPELVGDVLAVMRKLAADGMTMIVVTHEMGFARDIADRIVFMDGGRIVEQGPPGQMFENPREERTRNFLKSVRRSH